MDRQTTWDWAKDDIHREHGTPSFIQKFPMLRLRPGPHAWYVTLRKDGNLLRLPELNIAARSSPHAREQWSGALSVPSKLSIDVREDLSEPVLPILSGNAAE
jgi:hypothetical protein